MASRSNVRQASLGLAVLMAAAAFGASGPVRAATAQDALYGDPAHPNIAGMWNPEFAYFGPPPGGAPGQRPPAAAAPAGAAARPPPRAPEGPKLTPPYAAKFAAWQKKFEVGEQEPDTVTRCLAFGMPRFGTMPVEIIQTPGQITMNLGVLHDIRRIYMDGIGHTAGADPVSTEIRSDTGRGTPSSSRRTTCVPAPWTETASPIRTS